MDDDLVALNNHFGGSAADDIGKLTFGFLGWLCKAIRVPF
jgi:hypothetical protein